jgi:IS30 family transposase
VSIDERLVSEDLKRYYGDLEGGLIIGGKHDGAVLTLVERKTKHCLTYPLESKGNDEVMMATIIVALGVYWQ